MAPYDYDALKAAWNEYLKFHAEIPEFCAEDLELSARARLDHLLKGEVKWLYAVLTKLGNVSVQWTRAGCILEDKYVFKY